MIDVIGNLILGGFLSVPIIAVFAAIAGVLCAKRKYFAGILAIVIAGSSAGFICFMASPANEFIGEQAIVISFLTFAVGLPIVFAAAALLGKPVRPGT